MQFIMTGNIVLKSVKLNNFQKHKSKTINFSPNVTTLVGHTEAGKSTILRALEWLFLNRAPKGNYITHGESKCSVAAIINNKTIKRVKSKTKNIYKVNGLSLKQVGKNSTPDSVSKIVPLCEDNFQRAFDPPFWLSISAGQVSKNLNSIVDLSVMDNVLTIAASELRDIHKQIKETKVSIEEIKLKKEKLSWVKEWSKKLEEIIQLEKTISKIVNKLRRLHFIRESLLSLTQTKKIAYIANLKGEKAIKLADEIESLSQQISSINGVLKALDKEKNREKIPSIAELIELRKKGDSVAENCSLAEYALKSISQLETRVIQCKNLKQETIKRLKKLKGQICPTCHQPIKKLPLV